MNISYDNKTPENFDCWLATRPVITPSEVDRDRYSIPGRRGELLGTFETRGNATITFTLHQKIKSTTTHSIDEIMNWLKPFDNADSVARSRWFRLSYDMNYCYEILDSRISDYECKDDNYRRIEVELEVYPFKFRVTETTISSNSFTLVTDTTEPILSFSCSGTSGTITINGYAFTVYQTPSGVSVVIDVRRRITYYISGGSKVSAESLISCDYNRISLKNGQNSMSSSSGVSVAISKTREGYIV